LKRYIIFLLTAFFCTYASAAISIYPIEVSVGNSGASKIEVMSQSDKVAFVKVVVKKIVNAGTPLEKEIDVDAPDESGLIATPMKLAVTAGATRVVRLVNLNPPEKESTWRVYFEEVNAEEYESGLGQVKKNKKDASVSVNIIWGALVHLLPSVQTTKLDLNEKTFEFTNTGTVRIALNEIGECTSEKDCNWSKIGGTIYPGSRMKIKSFIYHPEKNYRIKIKNLINGKVDEIPVNIIRG